MDITIANRRAIITGNTSDTIFSQALTTLNFTADTAIADNTTVALVTPTGTALARAIITANTATLDTNTVECYDYVGMMPVNGSKVAYLVIGEADSIIGVAEVYVARNALADITPPTASVPVYPTSQELQAILARLTEIETNVNADKDAVTSLVEGFDEEVTKGVNQVNTATTDGVGSINALVDGFDTQVQEAVTQVNNATNSGIEAINFTTQQGATYLDSITNQGTTTITNATNTATTTIANATTQATTSIDNKVDAFNTILEQDRQEIADAVIEAEGARDEAETARDEASTSASNASTSAMQATEAKDTTVAIKDELQTALEEASGVADVANKALPCALDDFEGWTDKIINANILGKSTVISAPVGFIHIYDTNVPLAQKRVEWIKPNGDKVDLGATSAENPWFTYQQVISCGWVDGDTVYAVATRGGVTYKVTIPFVNGEPTTVTSVAVEGADVSGTALHSVKLSSGFVITSNGLIFNPNTLTQTAKLTLRFQRLVTSQKEDGVYVTTEDGTLLVNTDENGTPITTVKNTSINSMSTSSSLVAIDIKNLYYSYTVSCLCIGSRNATALPSIGFSVPSILQADIGDYIINRWGIFKPTNDGIAGVTIGNNVPLYRFKNPFKGLFYNDSPETTPPNVHRSGNSILFIFQRQSTYQNPCPALIIYKETEQ